jgi:hypothetical protein
MRWWAIDISRSTHAAARETDGTAPREARSAGHAVGDSIFGRIPTDCAIEAREEFVVELV